MAATKAKRDRWARLWNHPQYQDSIRTILEAQKRDPYGTSRLRYWLGLDLWSREEGLLVLAGIEPGTVVYSDDERSIVDGRHWVVAQPFMLPLTFSMERLPPKSLDDFGGDERAHTAHLKARDRQIGALHYFESRFEAFEHLFDHSVDPLGPAGARQAWPPVAFIA